MVDERLGAQAGSTSQESLLPQAYWYYQASLPTESLEKLSLLAEKGPARDWHCYAAIVFSKRGLNLPDLEKQHSQQCPSETRSRLSAASTTQSG